MNAPLFPEITVNGETIPSAAIAAEAQNHVAPKGKPGLAWRKAARALTLRKLLLEEAVRRGIRAVPAAVGPGLTETQDEAQIRALLDEVLQVPAPVEADLVAVWQKDPKRYRSPPLWEASHILCAADPTDSDAVHTAYLRAVAAHVIVTADAKAFGHLAKEVSDCSSKANGGKLGQLVPGDCVPEFEAALRELEPGQISAAPVRSRFGWHIIRLDACAKGQVLPYAAVRPRLAEAAEKAGWTRAAHDFADALMAAADVKGVDLRVH